MDIAKGTLNAYASHAHSYAEWSSSYETFVGLEDVIEGFERSLEESALILDAGCGAGRDACYLADRGKSVLAVDVCAEMFRAWQNLPQDKTKADRITKIVADMLRLPIKNNSVSGVWASASLLHLARDQISTCLSEFKRVLVPDGPLVVTLRATGPSGWHQSDAVPAPRWITLFQPDEIMAVCRSLEFRFTSWETTSSDGWYRVFAVAP